MNNLFKRAFQNSQGCIDEEEIRKLALTKKTSDDQILVIIESFKFFSMGSVESGDDGGNENSRSSEMAGETEIDSIETTR